MLIARDFHFPTYFRIKPWLKSLKNVESFNFDLFEVFVIIFSTITIRYIYCSTKNSRSSV